MASTEQECRRCDTEDCTLPETGPDAEDAMRDCNFRSLSRIFLSHLILTACASLESSRSRAVISFYHRDTCCCSEDRFHLLCLYIGPSSPCTNRARLAPLL